MSGSILPNAAAIYANADLSPRHLQLYQATEKFGGLCTRPFYHGSQSDFYGLGQNAPSRGICHSLGLQWAHHHAAGKDFWGWMMPGGQINPSVAQQIITQHANFAANFDNTMSYMNNWTDAFLGDASLVPVTNIVSGQRLVEAPQLQPLLPGAMGGFFLGRSLTPAADMNNYYKFVEMYGAASGPPRGHLLAYAIGQDVTMFDANYGEFWFPNRHDFQKFLPKFWEITGYGNQYVQRRILAYGVAAPALSQTNGSPLQAANLPAAPLPATPLPAAPQLPALPNATTADRTYWRPEPNAEGAPVRRLRSLSLPS